VGFDFRLDETRGVPVYLQLVQQVKQAIAVGVLSEGDQLPTVKEAVETLLVSPNTVLKAYGQLEQAGIVWTRHGVGTFVATIAAEAGTPQQALLDRLVAWFVDAHQAGLSNDAIDGLIALARAQSRPAASVVPLRGRRAGSR